MTFLPDEASERAGALRPNDKGKLRPYMKPSALILYAYGYCRYRNAITGRCFAENELLSAKTGINLAQLSTSKTELLEEGWIVRDPENLKWGVIPVMGAREFIERRRWRWQQMSEDERWKFQNSGEKIWNFQTSQLEKPNLTNLCLNIDVPSTSADAAAANLEIPNQRRAGDEPDQPCDDVYVEQLIEAGAYPPHLNPATVRFVWRDMLFQSRTAIQPWTPMRRQFRGWLKRQRAIVQEELPATAATVVAPRFDPGRPAAALPVAVGGVTYPLPPDPGCAECGGREEHRTGGGFYCVCRMCQHCSGTGTEIVEANGARGARRCRHLTEGEEKRASA